MFCGRCGTPIPEGGLFCPRCGAKAEVPAQPDPIPAPQVPPADTAAPVPEEPSFPAEPSVTAAPVGQENVSPAPEQPGPFAQGEPVIPQDLSEEPQAQKPKRNSKRPTKAEQTAYPRDPVPRPIPKSTETPLCSSYMEAASRKAGNMVNSIQPAKKSVTASRRPMGSRRTTLPSSRMPAAASRNRRSPLRPWWLSASPKRIWAKKLPIEATPMQMPMLVLVSPQERRKKLL